MNIPGTLVTGDAWQWDAEYGDYPAPTWDATAYFENASQSFSVAASANGTAHRFAETAANTAALKAGRYYVQVRVTDGSSPATVESGWYEVKADPASGVKVDHRSWARKALDEVEALILAMSTTGIYSGSVAGRTYTKEQLPQLMQLRAQLRGEVRTEEQGSAAGLGRNIKVRYGAP